MGSRKKTVNFDDYSDNYNEILNSHLDLIGIEDEYFARYKIELMKGILDKPSSILEYGCGIGRNLGFITEKYPNSDIHACDISAKSLDIARHDNPGVHFFNNQNESPDKKFDIIFIANVFHHIQPKNRMEVFTRLKEWLNEKGKIIIFEHNPYNPVTRAIVDRCPFDEDAVLLKPKELIKMAEDLNLKNFKKGYCLFFPAFLEKINFLENYLRWLPLGGQYFTIFEN